MSEEKSLLAKARGLDSQVLAMLYDEYSPGLYRYAMRRLGDPDLAEECVAETFARFLQALHRRRGPRDHLQAYLYRIAHNWIVDQFRNVKPVAPLNKTFTDERPNPEHDVAARMQKASVHAAIRKLTSDQQQVIVLKYLEGWENLDIARALHKPVGAVKSLQHRALAALRKHLQREEQG